MGRSFPVLLVLLLVLSSPCHARPRVALPVRHGRFLLQLRSFSVVIAVQKGDNFEAVELEQLEAGLVDEANYQVVQKVPLARGPIQGVCPAEALGCATFGGLAPGLYRGVLMSSGGVVVAEGAAPVAVTAASPSVSLTEVVVSQRTLTLRLVFPSGEPVPLAQVLSRAQLTSHGPLRTYPLRTYTSALTDSNGLLQLPIYTSTANHLNFLAHSNTTQPISLRSPYVLPLGAQVTNLGDLVIDQAPFCTADTVTLPGPSGTWPAPPQASPPLPSNRTPPASTQRAPPGSTLLRVPGMVCRWETGRVSPSSDGVELTFWGLGAPLGGELRVTPLPDPRQETLENLGGYVISEAFLRADGSASIRVRTPRVRISYVGGQSADSLGLGFSMEYKGFQDGRYITLSKTLIAVLIAIPMGSTLWLVLMWYLRRLLKKGREDQARRESQRVRNFVAVSSDELRIQTWAQPDPDDPDVLLVYLGNAKPIRLELPCKAFEGGEQTREKSDNGGCNAKDSDVCSVCLSPFAKGESARPLPCSHFFHTPCINSWLKRTVCCPLCKWDVYTDRDSPLPEGTGCAEACSHPQSDCADGRNNVGEEGACESPTSVSSVRAREVPANAEP